MASFKGDARDAQRARYGARVQEEMKEAFSRRVKEMRDETNNSLKSMQLTSMFSTDQSLSHQKFTNSIIGLQTHEQYKNKAKKYLNHNNETTDNHNTNNNENDNDGDDDNETATKIDSTKQNKTIKSISQTNVLSFADDDDDEDEEDEDEEEDIDLIINKNKNKNTNSKKRKLDELTTDNDDHDKKRQKLIFKNPSVNTSFLPDAQRDFEDQKLKETLEKEWYLKQKLIKQSRIEITYSYWDGSGHRRSIEIMKGIIIGGFLELVRKELCSSFSELRGMSGDNLMYIKDDLIIPHSYSFYDLIVTKACGKSKHLMFKNIVYDKGEYRIDRDGGHPGKVITRAWYDRNKHIFPASRWEVYDPLQHQQQNINTQK